MKGDSPMSMTVSTYQAMSDPKYFVYYAKKYTYTDWRASVI